MEKQTILFKGSVDHPDIIIPFIPIRTKRCVSGDFLPLANRCKYIQNVMQRVR